jgi:1-deoxy-D-xylulose-5-phosphate reductoisomerase
MTRRVSIFGATGSVGQSTVDLIARQPEAFRVVALTGGRNVMRLAADARRLGAELAVTAHEDSLESLEDALAGSGIATAAGPAAILEAAERPVDWAMSAIVGAAGLPPGLKVLEQGATLALANKESLVTAGPLVMQTAARHGATLLPVDSEHSAIFQALRGEDIASVERVILTASGGPFRTWSAAEMANVTIAQASRHPTWEMGQRITIDSASLFNKAMEVIETHEFFGIAPEKIEVLIHPESLIHALVGHVDGGLIAHLGPADMRHAIGYALNFPERRPLPVARLDFAAIGTLSFEAPDEVRFPALRLAREVTRTGGLAGAAFNAAKEAALDLFLARKLPFTGMAPLVERVLDRLSGQIGLGNAGITLDNVTRTDTLARETALRMTGP